jgi:sortase B
MKNKDAIYYALAAAGIVATVILARFLSGSGAPSRYEEPAPPEIVVEEAPMVAALTEEEIYVVYTSAKRTASQYSGKNYISPIVFGRLQVVNPHVYAWITIEGTAIDYPILQHPTDNDKYLNYNIDGSYGRPGCIYTENMNALDFSDRNTVIYGHNMRNGTMFADLHKFLQRKFFSSHREVVVYLPDRELHYEIFAAYIYDDRHLMYSFDFTDYFEYSAYLGEIWGNKEASAIIDKDMTVTAQDRIITLSTCVRGQNGKRLLVQAVLTNPEALAQAGTGYPRN